MTTIPYPDALLREILTRTRTIAAVGVSPDPIRPSNYVARYLHRRGYRVLPVNPRNAGAILFGEPVRESLAALAEEGIPVQMVDIFRRSSEAGAVVDEAIALFGGRGLETVWLQVGVIDEDAARRAEAAGLTAIMNRCPKIEHQRLFGTLRIGGFNTGVISSRRQ